MKNSLKNSLYMAIKCTHPFEFSLNQVEKLCKEGEYKLSNGERRLRELADDGAIEPVFEANKRYIKGYKFIVKEKVPVDNRIKPSTLW